MAPDLRRVSSDGLPALDLPRILIGDAAAHVVAAIPLKPAARVVGMDPPLMTPNRQWLASIDPEIVQRTIATRPSQLGACEPARRKLLAAIGHVLAAEHAKGEHLLRAEVRAKVRIEVASDGLGQPVPKRPLHPVIDDYRLGSMPRHGHSSSNRTNATPRQIVQPC